MTTISWVVARGGLLGSHVEHELRSRVWSPVDLFAWQDPDLIRRQIATALESFRSTLQAERAERWSIYWCAGAGVIGSSPAQLSGETILFRYFLEQLRTGLPGSVPGSLFLASSAGGVYGGSEGRPFTEGTLPSPISPYGRAKLEQESVLREWSRDQPHVSTVIGRISNLYGPGQRLDKPQGLISHISRCLIFNMPIHIYVPLDTIRDYLFAEDAARRIAADMDRLALVDPGTHVLKIYSSGKETSIGSVIGIFRQIAKRQLRVVTGRSPSGPQQPAALQFRSNVWPEHSQPRTELLEGIYRLHQHQLALYQAGRLPRPLVG